MVEGRKEFKYVSILSLPKRMEKRWLCPMGGVLLKGNTKSK